MDHAGALQSRFGSFIWCISSACAFLIADLNHFDKGEQFPIDFLPLFAVLYITQVFQLFSPQMILLWYNFFHTTYLGLSYPINLISILSD